MEDDIKYIDLFLKYNREYLSRSSNSVNSYYYDILKFTDFCELKGISYWKISSSETYKYIRYLREEKRLDYNSINRNISTLRKLFDFLIREDAIENNVFMEIKNFRIEKKVPEFLTREQVNKILNNEYESKTLERDRLILGFLFFGGMRASEVTEVKYNDIYLEDGFMKVYGKGRKERYVVLVSELKRLIDEYMKVDTDYTGFVVRNSRNNKISRQSVWTVIKKQVQISNINATPHTFRHSFATYLYENGMSQFDIKELLGHASIVTTDVYTHISRKKFKEKITEKIDELSESLERIGDNNE